MIFRKKLEFYGREYESGKISDAIFEDLRSELETDIEEIINRIRRHEKRIASTPE